MRSDLSFAATLPLTTEVELLQSLGWSREQHSEPGGSLDTLLYDAAVVLPALAGDLQTNITLGYGIQERSVTTLAFSASWFALISDIHIVYLSGGVDLLDEQVLNLLGGGYYQFEDGRMLDFGILLFVYRSSEPILQIGLGYTLPIDLPLERAW